jgi:type II secretory pathway component PulJ
LTDSDSKNPDLDWSQVRETVKLLTLSAAQVDVIMQESDVAVDTLTDSFTDIVESMQAINRHLMALVDSNEREQALACCSKTQEKIQSAIVAFQFYDRMQQCLHHVTSNLRGLSDLVENPERRYNPNAWRELQGQIRSRFTMEAEKVMFDAILQGKSVDEAIAAKAAFQERDSDNIELF